MADLTTLLSKFLNDLYAGILGTTLPITNVRVGDGTAGAPAYSFLSETTKGLFSSGAGQVAMEVNATQVTTWTSTLMTLNGNFAQVFKTTSYNNVTTAGWGIPAIYAAARVTAQAAANASIATYTVGASDGTFEVSANVLVTTATTHTFNVECAYTDEGNTARTVILPFRLVGDTTALTSSVVNTNGAVPYMGVPIHIRAKAATAITIRTQAAGTYTTVAYNAEGVIKQTA